MVAFAHKLNNFNALFICGMIHSLSRHQNEGVTISYPIHSLPIAESSGPSVDYLLVQSSFEASQTGAKSVTDIPPYINLTLTRSRFMISHFTILGSELNLETIYN